MKNKLTIDQLKHHLQKQYDLICFEDLADYYSQHGSIFDLFKNCYQTEFAPAQRLVLFSSRTLSQQFLNHVQYAAKKIDISNFFILIVNPFDLTELLDQTNKLHGNDLQPIQCLQLNISDSKPLPLEGFVVHRDTICPLPFTSVNINSSSQARPCCKFKQSAGSIQHTALKEIFDSEYYKKIRQQLSSGQQISECQACWDVEKHNSTSLRQHALTKFGDGLDHQWFDQPTLIDITMAPSNLCNFACRICNHNASSKIAAEEYVHSTNSEQKKVFQYHLKVQNNNIDQHIVDNVIDAMANTEFLHIMGGEPFLWPMLPTFLDGIIDRECAQSISLEFNTNASIFPSDLLQRFQKFKSVEILLSIDDIGQRFEIQRGGKWNEIVANLKLFSSIQTSAITVKVAPTVNVQNVLYLDQLMNFFNQFNFDVVWWYLEYPTYLSIDNTTNNVKTLVYEKYHNHALSELQSIAQRVLTSAPVSGQEFLQYINKLDGRRKQNFEFAHKEIFDAMSS